MIVRSDVKVNIGKELPHFKTQSAWSFMKPAVSDKNILCEINDSKISSTEINLKILR